MYDSIIINITLLNIYTGLTKCQLTLNQNHFISRDIYI